MSKKSFLDKVFSSVGAPQAPLWSLANNKCVAVDITCGAANILHGVAVILRGMASILSVMPDILHNQHQFFKLKVFWVFVAVAVLGH